MRNIVMLSLVVCLAFAFSACCAMGSGTPCDSGDSGGGCAACAEGQSGGTVWCDDCNVGYVAGEKTKCQGCVTAAANGTECPHCK